MSSYELEPAVLYGLDALTLDALADADDLPIYQYAEQAIDMAIYCARIYLRNDKAGMATYLTIEDHSGEWKKLDEPFHFRPVPGEPVPGFEAFTADLDLDNTVPPIEIEFPDGVGEFLLPKLDRLEATPTSFLETGIDLRFKYSVMQRLKGALLIEDGPHEYAEVLPA